MSQADTPSASTLYDEIAYPGIAFVQSHPARLALLARLFGLEPTPVERASILEVGCGAGENLMPLALEFPGAGLHGFDLAARPIERGQAVVRQLGLTNVQLEQMDLMSFPLDGEPFDFIIAHGFYSWVPAAVRDRLMAVIQARLAPHGVAYVSYNAYPGSHLREITRNMLRFHLEGYSDAPAKQQIDEAIGLVHFVGSAIKENSGDAFQGFLQSELQSLTGRKPAGVFHDELSPTFFPSYFRDFVAHAAGFDLQYLAEAQFAEMQDITFSPEVQAVLQRIEAERGYVAREQYLDFIRCRRFRQTLLCHANVEVDRNLRPEALVEAYMAAPLTVTPPEPDLRPGSPVEFGGPGGTSIKTDLPLAKAALAELAKAWPERLHFTDLLERAGQRVAEALPESERGDPDDYPTILVHLLFRTFAFGLMEFRTTRPPLILQAGEYPISSPLARLQAAVGEPMSTLSHTSIEFEDVLSHHLLGLLDGSRTRAVLEREMEDYVQSGQADTDAAKLNLTPPDRTTFLAAVPEHIEALLRRFGNLALLTA